MYASTIPSALILSPPPTNPFRKQNDVGGKKGEETKSACIISPRAPDTQQLVTSILYTGYTHERAHSIHLLLTLHNFLGGG